ncbi:nucleoside-diphosphate-sugar epimerase family protein [Exidia glandulosa HHB12029]|uniref:Nucleoside-diphosphate-sugar epimerase family protein n=1 Tax=Exidia glandulosa HHB12029 TaxID=1314781 RepID=A0A165LUC3_EXIGL|nr:nucleoside-diphosphate-sugar epimerase family protein [Exidia glandulosa HHB12029]
MPETVPSVRYVLVTGATGKQGRAVLDALLAYNTPDAPKWHVLALTRGTGTALKSLPNVTVVQGDLDNCGEVFKKIKSLLGETGLYGVYSVQVAFGRGVTAEQEIRQGKALADESAKAGVKHFVYSSVDRGKFSAPEMSLESPDAFCGIPHWDTKVHIERHIRSLHLPYTFVRPPIFYEGWLDTSINKIMGTMAKTRVRPHVKTQYIAAEDIGGVVGVVFENPQTYIGQPLAIAGDELTFSDIDAIWREVLHKPAPTTLGIVGPTITTLSSTARATYKFFDKDGYKCDIAKTKEIWPATKTFKEYLEAYGKAK